MEQMITLSQRLHRERSEILAFCAQVKKLYLYGTGEVSSRFVDYLQEEKIHIDGFIVTDINKNQKDFFSYPVYALSEVSFNTSNDGIIIAVGMEFQKSILSLLSSYGYTKNVYVQNIFYTTKEAIEKPISLSNGCKANDEILNEGYFHTYSELEQVGEVFQTDKNQYSHNYLNKYEFFLKNFKDKQITLLELGIFHGASLNMWSRYFPEASIIGVDIDASCTQYAGENRKVVIKDLSKENSILELADCKPSIIIDDASHLWSHQIKALFILFHCLPSGGIYIMEDLETSFDGYKHFGYRDAIVSAYDVCNQIATVVTSQESVSAGNPFKIEIESIGAQTELVAFIHGSCIFVKK